MKSDCCQAEIISSDQCSDHCGECKKIILYAYMIEDWARREACGVYRDFGNKLWFYWGIASKWTDLSGQSDYLGQVKDIVDGVCRRYNRDGDLISEENHFSFLKEYAGKVQNPEIINLFERLLPFGEY
jgi:hypothetical protein